MRCPRCSKENPDSSNFCGHCGARLLKTGEMPERARAPRFGFPILSIIMMLAILAMLWHVSPLFRDDDRVLVMKSIPDDSENGFRAGASNPTTRSGAVVGEVVIENTLGVALLRIPAAVFNGRWIALPVRSCYGGDRWVFEGVKEAPIPVTEGFWRDGDPVALWRLEQAGDFPGPPLSPWRADRPLSWRSMISEKTYVDVIPRERGRSERIIRVAGVSAEPGIFLQDGRIVGWTFGELHEDGFLWNGPPGDKIDAGIQVASFYAITFANSREEQFLKALASVRDESVQEQLKDLADGFRYQSALSPEQTPRLVRHDEITRRMRNLADQLLEGGFEKETADILDLEVLYATADGGLMTASLKAAERYYGYASAVDIVERLLEIRSEIRDAEELRSYARDLYLGWIRERMENGDVAGAWQIFQRADKYFHKDPEIRLLAAENALLEKDWKMAEGLLPGDGLPLELSERAGVVSAKVARMKAEEGKIVINFTPGLRHIPVRAVINDAVEQDFVIDTGATMVTIPSSAAESAGVQFNETTTVRMVSTAGGPARAREVLLEAITLEGRKVTNIKAWILDIPGRPDLGLLGLNYLSLFHMEINSEQGTLTLTPRINP